MITRGGMSEIMYYKKLRDLGMSQEYFFSLPYECQKAILMAGDDSKFNEKKARENMQKRMALKQYNFEEKVKEKVLTLLKKNR